MDIREGTLLPDPREPLLLAESPFPETVHGRLEGLRARRALPSAGWTPVGKEDASERPKGRPSTGARRSFFRDFPFDRFLRPALSRACRRPALPQPAHLGPSPPGCAFPTRPSVQNRGNWSFTSSCTARGEGQETQSILSEKVAEGEERTPGVGKERRSALASGDESKRESREARM